MIIKTGENPMKSIFHQYLALAIKFSLDLGFTYLIIYLKSPMKEKILPLYPTLLCGRHLIISYMYNSAGN